VIFKELPATPSPVHFTFNHFSNVNSEIMSKAYIVDGNVPQTVLPISIVAP